MAHDKFYGIRENKSLVEIKHDNIPGTVAIAHGGTGATTSSGALSNLGLTATATELNYVDGVTSNIQTQLNGKVPYVVKNNTDFNDMKTPGLYTMRSSNTNAPGGDYHSLIVNKSDNGNFIQQLAIKESSWNLYSRYLTGSTWSVWKQYALKENIPTVPFIEAGEWDMYLGYWSGGAPSKEKIWCFYYRIGDFVHVTGGLHITSSLESGKQLLIGTLPYTSLGFAVGSYIVNSNAELQGATRASNIASLGLNKNFVTLKGIDSSNISNGDYVALSITYKVS